MSNKELKELMSQDVHSEGALSEWQTTNIGAVEVLLEQTPGFPCASYGTLMSSGPHGVEYMLGVPKELGIYKSLAKKMELMATLPACEEAATETGRRQLTKDHFLSNTPTARVPNPVALDALGIDRPPTPIPKEEAPQRQVSYSNYSDYQLEHAYRLSPNLPPSVPSDPIFSSDPHSIPDDSGSWVNVTSDNESHSSSAFDEEATMPRYGYKFNAPPATVPADGGDENPSRTIVDPKDILEYPADQPFATTVPAHTYRTVSHALDGVTLGEHRGLLGMLCTHYHLRADEEEHALNATRATEAAIAAQQPPSPERKWTKKEKRDGKHLFLAEKFAEFGKSLDRMDAMAKENNRQMKEIIRAVRAENAHAAMAEAELAEAAAKASESDLIVAATLAQFGIGDSSEAAAAESTSTDANWGSKEGKVKVKAKGKAKNKPFTKGKGKKK